MCKCRIISFGKGFPQSYISSRTFTSKIWPFLSFCYTPDSNMKTSMKNMWGELMFASCSVLNILLCWVLYSVLQKIFLQCHFHNWFVINYLLNVFATSSKVGGCSRCRNLLWKWLSPLTRDSNRWFHHRYVTLAGSDHSFSLPIHDLNGSTKKPIHMEKFMFYIWNRKKTNFLSKL